MAMDAYQSPGIYVEQLLSAVMPIEGVGTSTAGFIGYFDPSDLVLWPNAGASGGSSQDESPKTLPTGVVLCTNFREFTSQFGGFSSKVVDKPTDEKGAAAALQSHSYLVHAVYGFFNNGGTRCYVIWVNSKSASGQTNPPGGTKSSPPPPKSQAISAAEAANDPPPVDPAITGALELFESIGEISIVAAPGITDKATLDSLSTHCKRMNNRIAVFDLPCDTSPTDLSKEVDPQSNPNPSTLPSRSSYAACYYPWLQVLDPDTQALTLVPPSGHVAGIYARVDTSRGVHKAPANEPVRGAVGLRWPISSSLQNGLNPNGVNCIRSLDGTIKVWGARTYAGDTAKDFKYVNVRRLFLYLQDSIQLGLQWAVFEPNNPDLWARITRNVSAFLHRVWSTGALFGATPEQAFYVKCDAETNPPEEREAGNVITEIGVAITRPAEFVIFRIGQWSGPAR